MTETPKRYSGCLVVGSIFSLALAAALAGLWFRYAETRQVLKLWGSATAQAISTPDKMEALGLEPTAGAGDLQAGGAVLRIVSTRDVTNAPGFTNARHALVLDRSFEFEPATGPADCQPTWTHAFRFTRGQHQATILLSLDCPRAMLAGKEQIVGIRTIVGGLKTLLVEQKKQER